MIELYARGYDKDPAGVAAQAIHYGSMRLFLLSVHSCVMPFFFLSLAKANKFDVVLVDTAGRMQNDEPLMIALAKVIRRVSSSSSSIPRLSLVNRYEQAGFSFIRW